MRSKLGRRLGRVRPWWRRVKGNGYHLDRCDLCGHRFRWSRDARHGDGSSKHWHQPCQGYVLWRRRADERLEVLGLMAELSGLTKRDVITAAEFRADDTDEWIAVSNRTWRAFYDLEKSTTPAPEPAAPVAQASEEGSGE